MQPNFVYKFGIHYCNLGKLWYNERKRRYDKGVFFMTYEVTKDLLTGNLMIDNEHRQLFDAINKLLDACSKGQGRNQLTETMNFLQKYIDQHFSHEEQLQRQTNYPDAARHKELHDGYKRVVQEIAQELHQNGPTVALVGKVNANIANWLVLHIKREDVKVAAHIHAATAK